MPSKLTSILTSKKRSSTASTAPLAPGVTVTPPSTTATTLPTAAPPPGPSAPQVTIASPPVVADPHDYAYPGAPALTRPQISTPGRSLYNSQMWTRPRSNTASGATPGWNRDSWVNVDRPGQPEFKRRGRSGSLPASPLSAPAAARGDSDETATAASADDAGLMGMMRSAGRSIAKQRSNLALKLGLTMPATFAEDFKDNLDGVSKKRSPEETEAQRAADERARYDQAVVDLLDVIDPEVSTLSTLSDVQNSLFVPNLGHYVNRAGNLRLTKPPSRAELDAMQALEEGRAPGDAEIDGDSWWRRHKRRAAETELHKRAAAQQISKEIGAEREEREREEGTSEPQGTQTLAEYVRRTDPEQAKKDRYGVEGDSVTARGEYLVLPDGLVDWDHWTPEERSELDDYVRHLLHSRKWKARRAWRGFRQYASTPLGAFVTIYASLLTFWGAAWILFIIGWLNAGARQAYFVEICDQILTALFCFVGIGLAPFRAVDTYHMYYIAKYHRKTLRLYREQGLPPLPDENDLPDAARRPTKEEARIRPPVLSVEEQATLMYHQMKFSKSHTFYKPHETATHKAFPLDLLIVVVCLLDFHSTFQMALGSTTWSISYHHNYKKILTSIILAFSISCNITAGLVITVGNRRTRKTEVVEERLRRSVTEEAIRRKQHKREEEEREERERAEAEMHRSDHGHGRKRSEGLKTLLPT